MFVLNRERNEEEWRNGERARGKKNETKTNGTGNEREII